MGYRPEDLARASFKYFFKKVLGYRWCAWHEQAYKDLQLSKRILYQIARGHGKTIFFSIAYPLWLAYKGVKGEALIISYSEEQVRTNIMNKIDEVVSTNDYLVHLRPTPARLWGAQLKEFPSGLIIRGESFGSSVRGAHPIYLNVDDPLKDKGGMSPEEQGNFYRTAILGTVIRDTLVVVDGTPLDNGDLLEQIEGNDSYISRKFPAENEERTKALFPELFTLEELRKIEKDVGSFAYSRERLLQRIDPKSQMFKDAYRTINTTIEYPRFACIRTVIDPAISEKENACDSAIVTIGVDYTNHKWELDTRLIQSDDPALLIKEILKAAGQFQTSHDDYAVVIEAELFQKVLANDLKQAFLDKHWSIRVIEVTHQGIQGKHERIAGLQAPWEARAIHLLPESPLISQFRYYRPRIKGFKIDGLDAFAWIRAEDVAVPIVDAVPFEQDRPDEY